MFAPSEGTLYQFRFCAGRQSLKLLVLGTGSAPQPRQSGRAGIGLFLSFSGNNILIDCGPGVPQNLIKGGVDLFDIHALFITHHHYDHTADLGLLVFSRWE